MKFVGCFFNQKDFRGKMNHLPAENPIFSGMFSIHSIAYIKNFPKMVSVLLKYKNKKVKNSYFTIISIMTKTKMTIGNLYLLVLVQIILYLFMYNCILNCIRIYICIRMYPYYSPYKKLFNIFSVLSLN